MFARSPASSSSSADVNGVVIAAQMPRNCARDASFAWGLLYFIVVSLYALQRWRELSMAARRRSIPHIQPWRRSKPANLPAKRDAAAKRGSERAESNPYNA